MSISKRTKANRLNMEHRTIEEDELNYYSMLELFDNDYLLFRDALIDLGGLKLKPKKTLRIIEDIRFYNSGNKRPNYSTIAKAIDILLDTKMDKIKQYKEQYNKDDSYTDKLFISRDY